MDARWLATLERDCNSPREPQDDPAYPAALADHVEVSAAYFGKILKACDREASKP